VWRTLQRLAVNFQLVVTAPADCRLKTGSSTMNRAPRLIFTGYMTRYSLAGAASLSGSGAFPSGAAAAILFNSFLEGGACSCR
jgi:hypothetical protein